MGGTYPGIGWCRGSNRPDRVPTSEACGGSLATKRSCENESARLVITEAEISALLDAHDVLVQACVDSNLEFSHFVLAYGEFPHNYPLRGTLGSEQERAVGQLFGRRIAFHLRVSSLVSGLRSADDPVDIPYEDAGRYLPAVGLKRLRELVNQYPDFAADSSWPGTEAKPDGDPADR